MFCGRLKSPGPGNNLSVKAVALLAARRQAGMTQEQVAAKMGVSQPSLARVEASLGSHRHSPSLEMLRKYAAAVNCKLEIRLVPQ